MDATYNQIRPADQDDPRDGKLPPALVERIHDDPGQMAPVARVYAANVLHEMYKESGGYTPSQKRDFMDLCTRLGDLDPKKRAEEQSGGGVTISINIPALGSTPSSTLTIDQPATPATIAIPVDSGDPEFEVVDE